MPNMLSMCNIYIYVCVYSVHCAHLQALDNWLVFTSAKEIIIKNILKQNQTTDKLSLNLFKKQQKKFLCWN